MKVSKNHAQFALATLFAINLLNFFDRFMLGALAEPIRKEWGLTDSQIGWLGTAGTLLYALVGVPLGRLSDRWHRPKIVALGVAAWSLLTAASGLAWNYGALFATRLGVGIGEASCAPASSSLISDFYPAKRRSRALSIFMLGLPLGTFLGTFISGRLAAAYGWRFACYLACIPGLLLAGLALCITEPPRGAAEASPAAGRPHEGSAYARILEIPTMRWVILSGIFFNFFYYAIGVFLPAFLSRYHGLNLKESNAIAAVLFGATGVPGLLLGGWAADHARERARNGRLLMASVGLLVAALCTYSALARPTGGLLSFAILMGTGCMLSYVFFSAIYAAIHDVIQPSLRSTAIAVYFFATYLLGGSFGPALTGRLSDHFARAAMASTGASSMSEVFRAAGLRSAMYLIPVCSFITSIVLLAAARTVSRDMNNLETWMTLDETEMPSQARHD